MTENSGQGRGIQVVLSAGEHQLPHLLPVEIWESEPQFAHLQHGNESYLLWGLRGSRATNHGARRLPAESSVSGWLGEEGGQSKADNGQMTSLRTQVLPFTIWGLQI